MHGDTDMSADIQQQTLRQEVAHRCPEVDRQILDDLFAQLDAEYFTIFTAPQIAAHLTLLAAVDDQHPVQVRVVPRSATSAEILLAAYDLFGEFAIITGAIAAHSLNILEGQVFSYRSGPGRTTPWGHTDGGFIIDLFTVEYPAAQPFDAAAQADFASQLTALIQLLRQGQLQQARDTLNYRLIDAIRTSQQPFPARLFPVEVALDNDTSADWTMVHITAEDTPGFLYSLANALAMRNVYIHRVRIGSERGKVQDRLAVGWRRGGKITSAEGQRELQLIVVLIKQFTHFLTVAPDPVMALQHFDQFLDRLAASAAQNESLQWLESDDTLQALATVLGSSGFLWEDFLRMQHATLLPVIRNIHETEQRRSKEALTQHLQQAVQAAPTPDERKQALNTRKDRELFRIDMRHLLHPDLPFGLFAEELTDLAEAVLANALTLAQDILHARYGEALCDDGHPCAFAVLGLGKLGGRGLGYASDIELLVVYEGAGATTGPQHIATDEYATLLVQQLCDLITARRAGIFEIDLRLRPFGSHGSLATSFDAFRAYYCASGQAAPFERQALIKLRLVAGDTTLGQQVEAWRDAYVYSPAPFDLAAAVALRQRQIDELVTPGAIDTKYSRGGLIDIEYTVQYLQLLHGASTPAMRTSNTLTALAALAHAGVLPEVEVHHLQEAYQFLRRLIDAQRIVRGNARDLVLPAPDTDEFTFLARRMGYWQDHGSPEQLAADITHHMQHAARLYREHFMAA